MVIHWHLTLLEILQQNHIDWVAYKQQKLILPALESRVQYWGSRRFFVLWESVFWFREPEGCYCHQGAIYANVFVSSLLPQLLCDCELRKTRGSTATTCFAALVSGMGPLLLLRVSSFLVYRLPVLWTMVPSWVLWGCELRGLVPMGSCFAFGLKNSW